MKGIIIIVIAGTSFLFLLIGLKIFIENQSCISAYSNYEPQWGFFSGCRINWGGVMTPVDIIREIK